MILSIIVNGYIHIQVIGMYCRLLNAQQGSSPMNHYFDPSFAVVYQYYLQQYMVILVFLHVLTSFTHLRYRWFLIKSLDKQKKKVLLDRSKHFLDPTIAAAIASGTCGKVWMFYNL